MTRPARTLTALHKLLFIALTIFLLPRATGQDAEAPVVAVDEPSQANDAAGKTPVLPPDHLIEMVTLQTDLRKLEAAHLFFRELTGDDEFSGEFLFGLLDAFDVSDVMRADRPSVLRYDTLLALPQMSPVIMMAMPFGRDAIKELFAAQDVEITDAEDGSTLFDGMPAISTDDYFVIFGVDDVGLPDDYQDRLQRMLRDTESLRNCPAVSIAGSPMKIGRSPFKPHIDGFRAMLATEAQRRDVEGDFDFQWRSLHHAIMIDLLDVFFNDIESIEYAFDWSDADNSISIRLNIAAAKKSSLEQYIGQALQHRNRALSWLHPEHESFLFCSLPLPTKIKERLPLIGAATERWLRNNLSLTEPAIQGIVHFFETSDEDGGIQFLLQSIPTREGSNAVTGVVPLSAGPTLSPAVVELTSMSLGMPTSTSDVAGWPLHELPNSAGELVNFGPHTYFAVTDHSVAVALGSEPAVAVLESLIERDYATAAEANLFRNTLFAVQTNVQALGTIRNWAESMKDLQPDTETQPLDQAAIRINLNATPGNLTLEARFDRNAALVGLLFFESAVELMLAGIDF